MFRYHICLKFVTLSHVWDQFIVLCENKSNLADILSVFLMAETLNYLKTYLQNMKSFQRYI